MASMDLQLDESSCKEFEDYFPLKLAFVQLKDNQWTEVESVLEENKDATRKSFYSFVGRNKHQSLILSKIRIDDKWKSIRLTIDNGSEVSSITTQLLNKVFPGWETKMCCSQPTHILSGPTGNQLICRGEIEMQINLCGIFLKTKVSILDSEESCFLLGSPELQKINCSVLPGEGICLNTLPKDKSVRKVKKTQQEDNDFYCDPCLYDLTGGPESLVEIKGKGPSRDDIADADYQAGCLPPITVQVKTRRTHSIPPWSECVVMFEPHSPELLAQYDLQQFFFKPCLCTLNGQKQDCAFCEANESKPPYQVCRYMNGSFSTVFVNHSASPMQVNTDFVACVESCREILSIEEVAVELLEVIEQEDLQPTFNQQEAKEQFDLDLNQLKQNLSQIICEPLSFSTRSIREPTLKMLPHPPLPEYSLRSISIREYAESNPCIKCKAEDLTMCDPLIEGCITSVLYEDFLPENPRCSMKDNCVYSWDNVQPDHKNPLLIIFCLRPGFDHLKGYLEQYLQYDGDKEIIATEKKNVFSLVVQMGTPRIIYESTKVLKGIKEMCQQNNIQRILFANQKDFSVSEWRTKRIFSEECYELQFCSLPAFLSKCSPVVVQEFKKKRLPPVIPQTERRVINPGLPRRIETAEIEKIQEKPVLEENILCNSPKIQKLTTDLLNHHDRLWSKDAYSVGSFKDKNSKKICKFDLKFSKLQPIIESPRWSSPAKRAGIKEVLSGLLSQGVITPSYSKFRMSPVFVQKKAPILTRKQWVERGNSDESYVAGTPDDQAPTQFRFTIDLSKLNAMQTDLPTAPCDPRHLISAVQHYSLMSLIDVSLAYNSLHYSAASAHVTSHYSGLPDHITYSHQRCIMGGRQSAACLRAALDNSLIECLAEGFIFLYGDDIAVLADSEEQMLENLAKTFTCLERSNFRLKRHKLLLYLGSRTPEVDVFGIKINLRAKTIRPIKSQVDDMKNRQIPTTLTQLRSTLGALNWMQNFLVNSQRSHQILHSMTRKNSRIEWSETNLIALEEILDILMSKYCLNYLPSAAHDFHLACDSSQFYAGICLWQQPSGSRPRIVGFYSKIFSNQQSRASSWERECLSVIMGLHCFWRYVCDKRTIIHVDSKTSVFISDYSHSNSKISRYKLFLENLPWVKVQWSPGSSRVMLLPDLLSRKSEMPKEYKNRQLTPENHPKIEERANKLSLYYQYSMKQSSYLLDYLLCLEENEIAALPDFSLKMNQNGEVECDLYQMTDNPHQIDFVEKRLKIEQQEKRNEGMEEKEKENGKEGSFGGSGLDSRPPTPPHTPPLPYPALPYPPLASGNLPPTCPSADCNIDPTDQWLGGGDKNLRKVGKTGTQPKNRTAAGKTSQHEPMREWQLDPSKTGTHLEATMYDNVLDSEAWKAIFHPRDVDFQPAPLFQVDKKESPGDRFLSVIRSYSPALDFERLAKYQQDDPKYTQIIERCKNDEARKWRYDQRVVYFLPQKNDILCRTLTDVNGIKRHQLCIPSVLAHDFCIVAHRSNGGGVASQRGAGHFPAAKLANLLSYKFYVPKLTYILAQISESCQACAEQKRHIRQRPSFFKQILTITYPGQGYYLDELQISSTKSIWNFNKVLILTDVYSNFSILAPLKRQLDQNYFIEILHLHLFALYGKPCYFISDNASTFVGRLVQQTCSYLNVSYNTTAKYSPQSNCTERINSRVLHYLRLQKTHYCLDTGYWSVALSEVMLMCNYSPYTHSQPNDSPAIRFFGCQHGVCQQALKGGNTYQSSLVHMFSNPEDQAKSLGEAWEITTKMRFDEVERRKQKYPVGKNIQKKPFEVGQLVTVKFRARPNMTSYDHKLARRSRYIFVVTGITDTTAYLRPYNLGSLSRWALATNLNKRAAHPNVTLPIFKISVADLQKVHSALALYNQNDSKGYFKEASLYSPLPLQGEVEVLTPVQADTDLLAPELEGDIYSQYTQFDETDFETQGDQLYSEAIQRAESKLKSSGTQIYHLDDEGQIYDGEGNLADPLHRVGTFREQGSDPPIGCSNNDDHHDDEKNGDDGDHQEADDHQRASSENGYNSQNPRRSKRNKQGLKMIRKQITQGERLANLAGYSLNVSEKIQRTRKRKSVKFSKFSQICTSGQDCILVPTSTADGSKNPFRTFKRPTCEGNDDHLLDSIIAQLDLQLLPDQCKDFVEYILGCSCNDCRLMKKGPPKCQQRPCEKCVITTKESWK